MTKVMAFLCLICISSTLHAQVNLVYNGSFEAHLRCPDTWDEVKFAYYWNSIDTSWSPGDTVIAATHPKCLPEYVNICGTYGGEAPENGFFYQYPRTGNGMISSRVYYDLGLAGFDGYDYLQGRLVHNLVAGKSYCVTFFATKGNWAGYNINNIGAYLDDGSIDTASRCAKAQTQCTPQILDTNIISDTLNWTKIQGSFIANGTEKFITIGDFFDTGNVRKAYLGGSNFGWYTFDDVSVIASDAVAYAGRDTAIKPGDTVSIGAISNGDGMPCWWYVLGGSSPIDSGGTIKVHPTTTTTYVVKMDLCGTVTYDTVQVRVWPAGVAPTFASLSGVTCYPNPATNEVTIEGAKDCEVVFYDVVGRKAALFAAITNKEVIDISSLQRGLYLVGITDKITGERVTRLLRVAQ